MCQYRLHFFIDLCLLGLRFHEIHGIHCAEYHSQTDSDWRWLFPPRETYVSEVFQKSWFFTFYFFHITRQSGAVWLWCSAQWISWISWNLSPMDSLNVVYIDTFIYIYINFDYFVLCYVNVMLFYISLHHVYMFIY